MEKITFWKPNSRLANEEILPIFAKPNMSFLSLQQPAVGFWVINVEDQQIKTIID
jgi:hypothetical protein